MDHADVLDRLEEAASERGGLDRLTTAGDAESRELRRHLSACPACRHEADALRLTVDAIAWAAPETLRPSEGARDRLLAAARAAPRPAPTTGERGTRPVAVAVPARRRWTANLGLLGGLAAAAGIAVLVGAVIAGWDIAGQRDTALQRAAAYRDVVAVTDEALRDPAHRLATLASPDGSQVGTVLYAPGHGEVAMVAHGLADPPGDARYRCFVERDGTRVQIGSMWLDGDLAYWAGPVEAVDDLGRPGDRVVVSLEADGSNEVAAASF